MGVRKQIGRLGRWLAETAEGGDPKSVPPVVGSAPVPEASSAAPDAQAEKSVSLAQAIPIFYYGRPMHVTDWTAEKAVRDGLNVSPWVYAAIDAYVKAISVAPHKAQEWNGSQWVDVADHPAERRFRRPNPRMSRSDLLARNVQDLLLTGNMLTSATDSEQKSRGTLELWPLPPDNVNPIPDPVDLVLGYKVARYPINVFYTALRPTSDQNAQFVGARDMVHVMFHDPSNPFWGRSPLQAAAKVVDTDVAAIDWNFAMLENRSVVGGIYTTPHPLKEDQHLELKKILKTEVAGSANAYSPMLLTHGTEWKETTRSPVDMDFVDGRKLNILDICAVYRIPPPLLGMSENATLANLLEYRRGWYEDSVIPLAGIIMDGYNRAWVWPRWGDGIRLVLDFSLVPALLPQLIEKIGAALKLSMLGYPSNIINRYLGLGLPDIEGGDIGRAPTNMAPVSDESGNLLDPALQEGSKVLALLETIEKRLLRLERRRR